MQNFARWYLNFLILIFKRISLFFKLIGQAFVSLIKADSLSVHENYIKFKDAMNTFKFTDWIFAIVILAINILFVILLITIIIKLLKRYVRFTKKEIEKEELLTEVGYLNQSLIDANKERNQILALKTSAQFGASISSSDELLVKAKKDSEDIISDDNRFTKLLEVDETYDLTVLPTTMSDFDRVNLKLFVKNFIHFSASQLNLYYSENIVRTFLASMASSKLIILEGISGTGKTSLPYALGKFMSNDATMISVQPSWTDRTELIGYLNEFTKKYNEPDFLKSIYETTYRTDVNLLILDEMNLARVEYYFADFLSVMEVPDPKEWLIEIVPNQLPSDPVNLKKGKILLPQNVWFIGTANKDDSTFTITDKVYDRAHSIELNERAKYIDAPFTNKINMSYDYLNNLFEEAILDNPLTNKNLEKLEELDRFLTKHFKITFGNRILAQTEKFIPVFVASGGTEVEGLDFIVARKIIRKFESINLAFLVDEVDLLLKKIDQIFGKENFPLTKESIKDFKRQI